MTACSCYTCTRLRVAKKKNQTTPFDTELMRMFLCSECGNKRCPHATDHRNPCTNSNEPGQPGSNY